MFAYVVTSELKCAELWVCEHVYWTVGLAHCIFVIQLTKRVDAKTPVFWGRPQNEPCNPRFSCSYQVSGVLNIHLDLEEFCWVVLYFLNSGKMRELKIAWILCLYVARPECGGKDLSCVDTSFFSCLVV
jgi:hypothetical protein